MQVKDDDNDRGAENNPGEERLNETSDREEMLEKNTNKCQLTRGSQMNLERF